MTINVTAVNDAPAGTDKTITMLEDETSYVWLRQTLVLPIQMTVPGRCFPDVKITTLPAAGSLTNNAVAVTVGDFILKTDIDTNKLVSPSAQ